MALAVAPNKIYRIRFGFLPSQTRSILLASNAVAAEVFHSPPSVTCSGGGGIKRPQAISFELIVVVRAQGVDQQLSESAF